MILTIARHIIPAALSILPPPMNTTNARAMLLAIGLQESKFQHRRQTNYGPARGFWQFEKAGIRGVVKHVESRGPLAAALRELRYEHLIDPLSFQVADLHYAVEDNDVLACVFARLLLRTLPASLPGPDDNGAGWAQYLDGWRPGKPKPDSWPAHFAKAWEMVNSGGA